MNWGKPMSIVCIKIGENEPSSYAKFDKLSKHMDIIEVLPRKRDKQGNLLNRTMGIKGDKHYLGLNVDMSSLTDEEFNQVRAMLKEEWIDSIDSVTKLPNILHKRIRYIDLLKVSNIGLSQITIDKINQKGELRRTKQAIDMMEINKFDILVSFENFAKCVVNKETNKTLEEELNLSGKTIKQVMANVRLRKL